MGSKFRLYWVEVVSAPSGEKVGTAPLEPTQGTLTVSPSVTERKVGGANMMTSSIPREVPDENRMWNVIVNILKYMYSSASQTNVDSASKVNWRKSATLSNKITVGNSDGIEK